MDGSTCSGSELHVDNSHIGKLFAGNQTVVCITTNKYEGDHSKEEKCPKKEDIERLLQDTEEIVELDIAYHRWLSNILKTIQNCNRPLLDLICSQNFPSKYLKLIKRDGVKDEDHSWRLLTVLEWCTEMKQILKNVVKANGLNTYDKPLHLNAEPAEQCDSPSPLLNELRFRLALKKINEELKLLPLEARVAFRMASTEPNLHGRNENELLKAHEPTYLRLRSYLKTKCRPVFEQLLENYLNVSLEKDNPTYPNVASHSKYYIPRPDIENKIRRLFEESLPLRQTTILLTGLEGTGKNTLAVHAVLTALECGYHRVVWLSGSSNSENDITPAEYEDESFKKLAECLEVAVPNYAHLRKRVLELQETNDRLMLIVDNLLLVTDDMKFIFTTFNGLFITSCSRSIKQDFNVSDENHLSMPEGLSVDEARYLIELIMDRPISKLKVLVDKCNDLGRNPLSVALLASNVKREERNSGVLDSQGMMRFLQCFESEMDSFDVLKISMSFMNEDSRQCYKRLSVVDKGEDIQLVSLRRLWRPFLKRITDINDIIDQLEDRHLLLRHSSGRFGLHFRHQSLLRKLVIDRDRSAMLEEIVETYRNVKSQELEEDDFFNRQFVRCCLDVGEFKLAMKELCCLKRLQDRLRVTNGRRIVKEMNELYEEASFDLRELSAYRRVVIGAVVDSRPMDNILRRALFRQHCEKVFRDSTDLIGSGTSYYFRFAHSSLPENRPTLPVHQPFELPSTATQSLVTSFDVHEEQILLGFDNGKVFVYNLKESKFSNPKDLYCSVRLVRFIENGLCLAVTETEVKILTITSSGLQSYKTQSRDDTDLPASYKKVRKAALEANRLWILGLNFLACFMISPSELRYLAGAHIFGNTMTSCYLCVEADGKTAFVSQDARQPPLKFSYNSTDSLEQSKLAWNGCVLNVIGDSVFLSQDGDEIVIYNRKSTLESRQRLSSPLSASAAINNSGLITLSNDVCRIFHRDGSSDGEFHLSDLVARDNSQILVKDEILYVCDSSALKGYQLKNRNAAIAELICPLDADPRRDKVAACWSPYFDDFVAAELSEGKLHVKRITENSSLLTTKLSTRDTNNTLLLISPTHVTVAHDALVKTMSLIDKGCEEWYPGRIHSLVYSTKSLGVVAAVEIDKGVRISWPNLSHNLDILSDGQSWCLNSFLPVETPEGGKRIITDSRLHNHWRQICLWTFSEMGWRQVDLRKSRSVSEDAKQPFAVSKTGGQLAIVNFNNDLFVWDLVSLTIVSKLERDGCSNVDIPIFSSSMLLLLPGQVGDCLRKVELNLNREHPIGPPFTDSVNVAECLQNMNFMLVNSLVDGRCVIDLINLQTDSRKRIFDSEWCAAPPDMQLMAFSPDLSKILLIDDLNRLLLLVDGSNPVTDYLSDRSPRRCHML